MFIELEIQASINPDLEGQIQSILDEEEAETFDTLTLINTDDISHIIKSNDGTTTVILKTHEAPIITLTPYEDIRRALDR